MPLRRSLISLTIIAAVSGIDVAVVPAGVHDARNLARVGKSGLLVDGERVDVAAKKDRAAGLSALDAGERARAEAAGTPRDACAVELGADCVSAVRTSFVLSSGCWWNQRRISIWYPFQRVMSFLECNFYGPVKGLQAQVRAGSAAPE